MNFKPDVIGHGYMQAALRIENRPGQPPRPEDKDEFLARLEYLHKAGVQAWWYSVSGKGSFPLFPSKYLPHHPDAVPGMYEWMAEEIHRRDMVAFSWEYMCTAPYYIREHPEDRMQFLKPKEPMPEEAAAAARAQIEKLYQCNGSPVPCYRSPYGQALMDYCVEVVTDLGWDGIWFDGSMLAGVFGWPEGMVGCRCPRCQKAFKDETGLDIPEYEDWDDPDFRVFLKWRQETFTQYWYDLCAHVRAHDDTALIVLNNFQRLGHVTGFGGALNYVGCEGLIAAEIDQLPEQCIMQMKYLRAMNKPEYVPDIWIHQQPRGPNGDPSHTIYYGELCMTAGGFPCMGPGATPRDAVNTLSAIGKALKPKAPYTGGELLRYAGIVLSSNTKDFAFNGEDDPTWRSTHGMHNIFLHAHLPAEIILDNQVTVDYLKTFPVVVLSDTRCLSDEQARSLEAYVEQGGLLLVTDRTGLLDELGWERETGALDRLLGIRRRSFDQHPPDVIYPRGKWALGLPTYFTLESQVLGGAPPKPFAELPWVEFEDDVAVLADTAEGEQPHSPAIITREVGQGRVIYINNDIGGNYSQTPWAHERKVLIALVDAYSTRPYQVEASAHVVVEPWRQADGRIFFHLLSQPADLRKIRADYRERRSVIDMGTIPPSGPITITLPWEVSAVSRPITGGSVSLEVADGRSVIEIENVDKHDILVVE